jgi:hypothetical protein
MNLGVPASPSETLTDAPRLRAKPLAEKDKEEFDMRLARERDQTRSLELALVRSPTKSVSL